MTTVDLKKSNFAIGEMRKTDNSTQPFEYFFLGLIIEVLTYSTKENIFTLKLFLPCFYHFSSFEKLQINPSEYDNFLLLKEWCALTIQNLILWKSHLIVATLIVADRILTLLKDLNFNTAKNH